MHFGVQTTQLSNTLLAGALSSSFNNFDFFVDALDKFTRLSLRLSELEQSRASRRGLRDTEEDGPAPIIIAQLAEGMLAQLKEMPDYFVQVRDREDFSSLIEKARRGDQGAAEQIKEFATEFSTRSVAHREDWLYRGSKDLKLPDPLIDYRLLVQTDTPPMRKADPPGLPMSSYRMAEESAIIYLLGARSQFRLILIPSVWGAGKTRHILPHIREDLEDREIGVTHIDALDTVYPNHPKVATLKNRLKLHKTKGPEGRSQQEIVLINKTVPYVREGKQIKRFRRTVERSLEHPGTKIALFGGSPFYLNTKDELDDMQKILDPLLKVHEWASVSIRHKPLNAYQAFQLLTEDAVLNKREEKNEYEDKIAYFRFVMQRIPPFLRAIHPFSLSECPNETRSLDSALAYFGHQFETALKYVLRDAQVFPEGGDPDDPITERLKSLQDNVYFDISNYKAKREIT